MKESEKISTGLSGLDEILYGGFLPQKSYLVQGGPGSGKSTLGLYFLKQAVDEGEKALYITLGEPKESIVVNASRLGIDISGVTFLDLSPRDDLYKKSMAYNIFSISEVEQGPIMESITASVEEHRPTRVLLDSITMLRFLHQEPFHMRKMALSFIYFICSHNSTLMMTSESLKNSAEKDATFWVDGIIKLGMNLAWRTIEIAKFRGSEYLKGKHSFKITNKGIKVFPQLRPNNYNQHFKKGVLSSGINELDKLLQGGIEKGTTNLIVGATGVGKTNLGLQFAKEAASRNDRSVIYTFEESAELIIQRSKKINIPIDKMIDSGNLKIMPIEPLSYSPDEFLGIVKTDIEQNGTSIVMIDSVGGYNMAVHEANTLERLHALTVYLRNMGVTTLLINETYNVTGEFTTTEMNASYLADNIIFLRYLEISGHLCKAIGVLKKRLSGFETSIRKFEITSEGIKVGKPLVDMKGILTGMPEAIQ